MTLAALTLLVMGALYTRQQYLTRGIPQTLPEPTVGSGTILGLNVQLAQYDDEALQTNLQAISDLGIRHVKQSFYFTEPYDWEASDRLVTAVNNANLTLTPLLDGDPAAQFAQPDTAAFAQWAGQFAARYGQTIDHYIIWDEPNLTTHWGGQDVNPIEYAALLTAASAAIRQADPTALIIAAPLAPTIETGPTNLAEHRFLQRMYEAGAAPAFDIAAAKPYGFDNPPDDRRTDPRVMNASRVILMREVMERNGDGGKAIWAGNWGWNALPANWQGPPSIWGEATFAQQAQWTMALLNRAQTEWPWMGRMFLETWEPNAPPDDPRWGFSLKNNLASGEWDSAQLQAFAQPAAVPAMPGFHFASPGDASQVYTGGWEFSPEFGADISQTPEGQPPDRVTFTFWGTDVGLRVRRANFRARLYITVDGRPANALPKDENGTTLVLTAPDPDEDYVVTVPVAARLEPGTHTVEITASRGWDQWALNGFSVGYHPPDSGYRVGMAVLAVLAAALLAGAGAVGRQADWRGLWQQVNGRFQTWQKWRQVVLTAVCAAIVALSGWLTWSAEAEGIYRRLGDGGQLALTAGAAAIFYISPSFIIYLIALAALWLLLTFRPVWGLALIAFSAPLYVLPKPVMGYLFSPVEIFTLVAVAGTAGHWFFVTLPQIGRSGGQIKLKSGHFRPIGADYAVITFVTVATLSLLFTERLDVATNEWRVVIVEPALFYGLWRVWSGRASRQTLWAILDAFVLGGVVVAVYGLGQYFFAPEQLITAEGGLMRLRAFFGSPNNVALYLDRVVPVLLAVVVLGNGRRQWLYGAALLPVLLAFLLTFSRGGLLLGLPAGLIFVFWQWQQRNGRRTWPWLLAGGVVTAVTYAAALQIPQLAGRLSPTSATSSFRLNLWQSSLQMIREHPLFGVGLDNFLYAYRGRYILERAWQEPNLNHPHNIFFDFATRLGLVGLLAGGWLWQQAGKRLWHNLRSADDAFAPVAVGLAGAFVAGLAHGLVDHSFFLVDMAYLFYLLLGASLWLENLGNNGKRP